MAFTRFSVAAVLILTSHTAVAGVNVWTSNGPAGGASAIVVDPTNLALYAAGVADGRSAAFRSLDHGASWTVIGDAPAGYLISALAVDPARPGIVYVATATPPGAWPNGNLFRSLDGGESWVLIAPLGNSRIVSLRAQPAQPATLYGAISTCVCVRIPCFAGSLCSSGILRSRNSGVWWSRFNAGLSLSEVTDLALDPLDPDRLFAGGDDGVFASADEGEHWSASGAGLETCPSITALIVDPRDGVLYAGTARYGLAALQCGAVFRSRDAGRTWTITPLRDRYVTSLAVDPSSPEIVYAGASRPAPEYPEGGVFRSTDGGETWERLGSGLPQTGVTALALEPSGVALHAATPAGVFDYEIVPGARTPVLIPRSRETRTIPSRP